MKVIYLTGAPAAGKSSTLTLLCESDPSILRFEYGAELTEQIRKRDASLIDQDELREKSSGIVGPEDVAELDRRLLKLVEAERKHRSIIIDSHPVTKEVYGYRITAFSQENVVRLAPDEIWVLYASPQCTVERISNQPAGRPMVTEEEARLHTQTQASIAATYGIIAGTPVYMFDTDRDQDELVEILRRRLKK